MERLSNGMLLKQLVHFTLLCICLFLFGCNVHTDPSTENEKKLITEISEARAKAFNEGNAAAIAIHFTEDALLMAPGKPAASGRAAVQTYYQSIFDDYTTQLESRYEKVEISGNLAYGRGFVKVTLVPKKGGAPLVSTAKYLNILKKQPDGLWKTTHDIWNGNEQP
jgi:uncharacterized protein (TIGR02246 family)